MKKTILIFCPYPVDSVPGQRLKYEQYIPYLESNGYTLRIFPFFSPETYRSLYDRGKFWKKVVGVLSGFMRRIYQLRSVTKADGIYVFLNVVPVGPVFIDRLFVSLSKRVIFDIDDMVHLNKTSPGNQIARLFRPNERYFYLMRRADHVITCTPALDSLVRRYNHQTTDISSTVDTDRYIPVVKYANDKLLVIGWSGSHSTVQYLYLLTEVFQRLAAVCRFKLLVLGTGNFSIDGVEVESIPWSTEVELPTLQRMDIGVYPLPDDEWVKGKSGLKAIQYMSLGLPVVAANVGCNDRVIEDGLSGLLVRTDQDWFCALRRLITEPFLREAIGLRARRRVEELFSVRANRDKYLEIFRKVYNEHVHNVDGI